MPIVPPPTGTRSTLVSVPRQWLAAAFGLAVAGTLASGCTPSASAGVERRDGGGHANAESAQSAREEAALAPTSPAAVDAGAVGEDALPSSTSGELSARARHLVEAIAQNNPQLAVDIVFPRDAFLATRDGADNGRAWEKSVNSPFCRSIGVLHKRVKGLDKAQFIALEIGRSISQLVPKRRDWKTPLWRVRHSHITVSVEGRTQRIDIAEMVGWRGAWYITKVR